MLNRKFHDYYAFICHRSADKPLAIAIQRKLEKYAIPGKILKENNYPSKYIRHICVDITEFENNNLHADILNCLEKSDKLIVICSELSASPVNGDSNWKDEDYTDWRVDPVNTGWVGFELLHFINMDRKASGLAPFTSIDEIRNYLNTHIEQLNDQEYRKNHPEINPFRNIIPVVKDGDPVKRTCFHPIIKLAIDRGLLKWYEAKDWNLRTEAAALRNGAHGKFIDLILAVLAPKDAEEFRRRDKIRRRFQVALTSIALVILATIIAFAVDYRIPHESYYSDYVLENELPQGIGKLSVRETQALTDYYKITTTKYNKTMRLEHVNSLGTPIEDENANHIDAPMIAVYKCRQNWSPDVCEYLDRNGIVQMTYAYATDLGLVRFQENDFVSNQVYPISTLNEYGIPNRMKIDHYGLVHDQNGRLVKKMYMSGVNYVFDDKGVAGETYEYDTDGHLAFIHYINRNEDYINNQDGIHGIKFSYDRQGSLSGYTYVNKDGKNIYCGDGYSAVKIEKNTSETVFSYLDTKGSLIITDNGYAVKIQTLNENMLPAEINYFGKNDNPAYSTGGFHKIAYIYNENGDVTDISFFNTNNKLVLNKAGYARSTLVVDENGNILQERFFGSDNKEILLNNKASTVKREFNDAGFLISESFYGLGEKPVYSAEGYQNLRNTYDDKNRLTCIEYFGTDNKKSYTKQGYHKIIFDYDDRGNMVRIRLYNTSDRLVPYSGYWAEQLLTYNGGGQVIKLEYLNQFEQPVNVVGGYAVIENEYEDNGLLKETAYYDNEGHLCDDSYVNSYGVLAGLRYYAKITFKYDEFGNVIRTDYYDTNDKLITGYLFSSRLNEYDEVGHRITERYLDENGNPPSDYYSYVTFINDDFGRMIETSFFGENDTPLETTAVMGAHLIKTERDARGLILCRTAYDTSGTQVEEIHYSYDDNRNVLSEEYFDANHMLADNEAGIAQIRYEYNALGNQTKKAYYSSAGELCEDDSGIAIYIQEYDDNGSLSDLYFYDKNERPVNRSETYSHLHQDFTEYRTLTYCEYRDKNDILLFSYNVEYNDNAQVTKECLYGPDGNLYSHPTLNVALRELEYDNRGNQISEKYYSSDGSLAFVFGVFSGWSAEYDDKSLETRRTYYGPDDKPIMIQEGFASAEFIYDEYGREIERNFYDEWGNKVNTKFGFASYKVQYDESGKIQKYTFYDKDGIECSADGEVKLVELNLHDGDIDTSIARYNPDGTKREVLAVAPTIYNIYRIAFLSTDGEYDLLLQPYIPLSPSHQSSDYIDDIKVRYAQFLESLSFEGDPVPIQKDIQDFLIEYTDFIEKGDGNRLWNAILMDQTAATLELYKQQLGLTKSKEELLEFYYNFYVSELSALVAQLTEAYGDYTISYKVRDVYEYSGTSLNEIRESFKQYGTNNIERLISLNVAFTVSGNNKKDIVTDSFLYPNMLLVKVSGTWKLMSSAGFPSPEAETLLAFLGLEE